MGRLILSENDGFSRKENIMTGTAISQKTLLKNRSANYINLMSKFDTIVSTETRGIDQLINIIQEEFGNAELVSFPIGILSKCYLGHPFDVHTLDLSGNNIVRHFKVSEPLPDGFEKARSLAVHNSYALIEIYKDCIVLVRSDGSTVKM